MKKNILNLIAITVLTGLSVVANAQTGKAKTGDKLFDNYLYSDAIYVYEGISSKNENVNRKLGESYRRIGDPFNAEKYYEALFSQSNITPEDVWNYAEVLKMNKKYPEALAKISQYNSMKPGERRAEMHLADNIYYDKLIADNSRFTVINLEFNSPYMEYAPSYYNAQIVFVTSRPIYSFTEHIDGWTDKRFTNLFAGYDGYTKKGAPTLNDIRDVQIRGGLSKKYHEGPASFTTDGLTMVFTRNAYEKKKDLDSLGERELELWISKLDVDGKWRPPSPLHFNNFFYNVGHPAISPDGKTLYFVSDMPGGFGGTDLYKCSMTADGVFGIAQNMGPEINTEGDEEYPFMHEKGVLFFASNGHPGLGGLDLFCTKLTGDKVGKITNLGGSINSSMDDFSLILDISMKRGFFSSNRLTGKGSDDIYGFEVLKPLNFNKAITGIVKDKESNEPIAGALIKLFDTKGNVIGETATDANGSYNFDVEPNMDVALNGNASNYKEVKKNASTKTDEDIITVDMVMEKLLAISLACVITDKAKGAPIDSTHIMIYDKFSGTLLFEGVTDKQGKWRHALEKTMMNTNISYTIKLDKKGYIPKTIEWSYRIYKEEEIRMSDYMDFTMGQLEIGIDLGKLLGLKPIYFDKGKWNIRPDASLELEKIVTAMILYPNIVIELDSHTDCRSSAESNHELSQKRADASVAYIVGRGIAPDRIKGKGMGEDKPVNGCVCEGTVKSTCSEDEHQANRRTEFLIVDIR